MSDPYTLHVISNDPFRDYPEPQDEEDIEIKDGPALDVVVSTYVSELQSIARRNDQERNDKTLRLCTADMGECSKRLGVFVSEPGGPKMNITGSDVSEDE